MNHGKTMKTQIKNIHTKEPKPQRYLLSRVAKLEEQVQMLQRENRQLKNFKEKVFELFDEMQNEAEALKRFCKLFAL